MISRLALGAALLLAASIGPACANRDLFVVDLVNNPASLDPQVQWDPDSYFVYRNVFDNLVTRDVEGKIVPEVATAWSYQSDTRIIFTVRDDIRFEDGSLLTPDDVVFTIKRITDPTFKSPQLSQFDSIDGAQAVGANQVRLTTKRPYPVLLAQLVKLSIVPRAVVEKLGNDAFNQHPVGSGPYRLTNFTRGVKVELVANPSYWRGAPPFPRVEMRPVPNEETRIADVRTARADIVRVSLTDVWRIVVECLFENRWVDQIDDVLESAQARGIDDGLHPPTRRDDTGGRLVVRAMQVGPSQRSARVTLVEPSLVIAARDASARRGLEHGSAGGSRIPALPRGLLQGLPAHFPFQPPLGCAAVSGDALLRPQLSLSQLDLPCHVQGVRNNEGVSCE